MQYGTSLMRRLLIMLLTVVLAAGMLVTAGTDDALAAAPLTVTPASKIIYVGGTATVRSNQKVKWSIVNKRTNVKFVAKTSKTAKVKGLKAGTVYLKAKSGRSVRKVKLVVRSRVPSTIELTTNKSSIAVGDKGNIYVAEVTPSYASTSVNFYSSDESIATVDEDGRLTAVGAGTVTIVAKSKLNSSRKGRIEITVYEALEGEVTLNVELSDQEKYPAGKPARVWIPIPKHAENQVIPSSSVKWSAPKASTSKLVSDSAGNMAVYLEWDENTAAEDRTATVSFHVSRRKFVRPSDMQSSETGSVDEERMAEYLKESSVTGALTDGVVAVTASDIVKKAGAETVYQKAEAIYNWTCDNLLFDKKSKNTGWYSAEYILNNRSKRLCSSADVSAVFVALCRAEGIPARIENGVKLDSMRSTTSGADLVSSRAQFYLPGFGWASVDIASVLKVISGYESNYVGKDAPLASKWNELKGRFWISTDKSWLQFSTGDDISLTPGQSAEPVDDEIMNADGTLKSFAYPYAEYEGSMIKGYNQASGEKSGISYSYSFDKDEYDCGCD